MKGATAQLWQIEVLEEFVGPELRKAVKNSVYDPNDGYGPVSLHCPNTSPGFILHDYTDTRLALRICLESI